MDVPPKNDELFKSDNHLLVSYRAVKNHIIICIS